MPGKTFAYAMIAVFAASFIFDWVYHGMLLMPMYEATASLWRPQAEMEGLMPFCILRHLLVAGVLAWIFIRHFQSAGTGDFLSFGLYVGLLMGLLPFGSYVALPIPMMLAVAWLAGGTLLGLIASGIVAQIYKRTRP